MPEEVNAERWQMHSREHEMMERTQERSLDNLSKLISQIDSKLDRLSTEVNSQRGLYVNIATYDERHKGLEARVAKLEHAYSMYEGQKGAYTVIWTVMVLIIPVIISVVAHFGLPGLGR